MTRLLPVIGQPIAFTVEHQPMTGVVFEIASDGVLFADCGPTDDPEWARLGARIGYGLTLRSVTARRRVTRDSRRQAVAARQARGLPADLETSTPA